MANFMQKALLSLVMDKQARNKLELAQKFKKFESTAGQQPGPAEPEPKKSRPTSPPDGDPLETIEVVSPPDRNCLIRDAMAVRREKTKLLDNLSPEDQFKLKIMAAHAFRVSGKDDPEN
jgi:hypothetical protein